MRQSLFALLFLGTRKSKIHWLDLLIYFYKSVSKYRICVQYLPFAKSAEYCGSEPWMKEVKGIRHRGRGVYLRCPVFTTVQFSLPNEGSSEYICLCEGREILSPNFQTFQDPRHQFHGIGRLVSETVYLFATLALLHIQAELILGTFFCPP